MSDIDDAALIAELEAAIAELKEKRKQKQKDQSKRAKQVFTKIRSTYSDRVSGWIRDYAVPDGYTAKVMDTTWHFASKPLLSCNLSGFSLEAYFRNRCALGSCLDYFSSPEIWDATLLTQLARSIGKLCPAFAIRIDDQELFRVLKARHDHNAFNALWESHQKIVLGFIRSRVWPGPEADDNANEILHNTFVDFRTTGILNYDPTVAKLQTFAKSYAAGHVRRFFEQIPTREIGDEKDEDDREEDEYGEDPPVVDDPRVQQIREMLEITLNLESAPHQLIIFGFNRWLGWKPSRIVQELSSKTLAALLVQLEEAYVSKATLEEAPVRRSFQALRQRLGSILHDVLTPGPQVAPYEHLLHRITGEIELHEFYTAPNPTVLVAKWVNNVRKSVIKEMFRR